MGFFTKIKKYEPEDIKKMYENAERHFNPQKAGGNNREPSPGAFTSKLYFKFLSLNYKTIQKAMSGSNKDYIHNLDKTSGDYSRRPGPFYDSIKESISWINDIIKLNPRMKYSILGVYKDIFEALNDNYWRQAFKLAFDYSKNTGDKKTISSGYKTLYYSLVIALETLVGAVVDFQLRYSLDGKDPVHHVVAIHYELPKGYMDKVVNAAINLVTLMKNTKDPVSYVKNLIKGENNAIKNKESLGFIEDENAKACEGLFSKAFGENKFLWAIVATGFTALAIGGGIGIFAFVLVLVFCIVPCCRHIIYYVGITGIDLQKQSELNAEMLSNNIKALQEKLMNSDNDKEREKLSLVIEKQTKALNELKEKLYRKTGNLEYAVDNELDKDDVSSSNEAESQGTETDVDGDPVDDSSSDDGGEFELSI